MRAGEQQPAARLVAGHAEAAVGLRYAPGPIEGLESGSLLPLAVGQHQRLARRQPRDAGVVGLGVGPVARLAHLSAGNPASQGAMFQPLKPMRGNGVRSARPSDSA